VSAGSVTPPKLCPITGIYVQIQIMTWRRLVGPLCSIISTLKLQRYKGGRTVHKDSKPLEMQKSRDVLSRGGQSHD
jgi:hypothetical protein